MCRPRLNHRYSMNKSGGHGRAKNRKDERAGFEKRLQIMVSISPLLPAE